MYKDKELIIYSKKIYSEQTKRNENIFQFEYKNVSGKEIKDMKIELIDNKSIDDKMIFKILNTNNNNYKLYA